MSKTQMLRALVIDRLTTAAEEIFELFEKTVAEYEEELCRFKKENQQLQTTNVLLHREEALTQTSSSSPPEPCLNQELTESQIKEEPEEPIVKQEGKELAVCVPEFNTVSVKSEEESSLLVERETEHREDISSEPLLHTDIAEDTDLSSETDNDYYWKPRFSWSAEQMKTEADGDQIREGSTTPPSPQNQSAPERSVVHNGDMPGANEGCRKKFTTSLNLKRHLSVHTGEVIYSCPICMKTFTRKFHLEGHIRTHTSEKPFSCSLCKKTFGRKDCLRNHMRIHTGEKPFHCPTCNKAFADQSNLAVHKRIHTGERPYSCTLCDKSYGHKGCLKSHMRTHTGEKNHSCYLCGKSFGKKAYLDIHMRCHTGEKPYVCSVCFKAFSVNSNLNRHMKSHEEEKQAEGSEIN